MTLQQLLPERSDLCELDSLTDSPKRVAVEEAIRERWRLHPHAHVQEIAAMMELEGAKVSSELVERLRQEVQSTAT
jgi:GTPase Era involved in 16S rRNA processing